MNGDELSPRLSDLIPLEEVAKRLPTNTHRSTVYRWAKGTCGVRLRVVTVGRTRCTTEQWLFEFFEAAEQSRAGTSDPATPRQRRHRSARSARYEMSEQTQDTLRRHGLAGEG